MNNRRTPRLLAGITVSAIATTTLALGACSSDTANTASADESSGQVATEGAGTSGESPLSAQPSSLVMAAGDSFPRELRSLDSVFVVTGE